jgi:hypothetical protein
MLYHAIGSFVEFRVQVPHGSDFRIGRNIILGNKAEMILYIISDVDLQANIWTTGTSDVTELVTFPTAINVER